MSDCITSWTKTPNYKCIFSDSQRINGHFDFNPKNEFVYLRSYENTGSESIDVTTIEDSSHNHGKVGNAEESVNFILIFAVIGIIIVVLAILIVVLYFYWKSERQIPPEVKNELDITYSKRSTDLIEEFNKNVMDDIILVKAIADVTISNKDNYFVLENMNENEKEENVKEFAKIITDL